MRAKESFEGILDDLSQMYITRDWKEIDFDALKDEHLPGEEDGRHQDKAQDRCCWHFMILSMNWQTAMSARPSILTSNTKLCNCSGK